MTHAICDLEEWLPVLGHPGYDVSSHGRVRSYRDRQGHPIVQPRLMSPGVRKNRRRHIKLGRRYQQSVHVLVLTTFAGPCPAGMECRHLDGNPANNHVNNLRWGTKVENYDDRRRHGTANDGERHGHARLSNSDVQSIRSSSASSAVLSGRYGISTGNIYKIRGGRAWRGVEGAPTPIPGRRKGEQNNKAKLTEQQVIEIRSSTASRRDLATQYKVTTNSIGAVQTGKTWRHLL